MNRQISFKQYRTIDLSLLMVMLAVCQLLAHFAVSIWFPEQLYVASPVAGLCAMVMMRWGGFAAVHALLGGVIYAALAGGTWQQILIYGIGNLASLAALVMLKHPGKERVRNSGFLSVVFALCVQLLMWLGRFGMAALFGGELAACLGFVSTDILSGLFTLLIVWVVRKIDGLFEDQKHYLLRMERERQAERREQN